MILYPSDRQQEAGSVFTTEGKNTDVVWVLTCPGRTQATVTYRRTALSPEADQGVQAFARHFPEQREHWQSAINQRLRAIEEQHEKHN